MSIGLSLGYGVGLSPSFGSSTPVPAWTPAAMTSLAWYDFSDTSSITSSGNQASAVNDLSGNSHHLTQATLVDRPQTGTREINSLNVLDFVSDDSMDSSSLALPADCDLLFVAQPDVINNGSDALLSWRASWTRDWQFDSANSTNFRGRWTPQSGQNAGTSTPWNQGNLNGAPKLFGLTFDSSALLMTGHLDGVAVTTATGNYTSAMGSPGTFRLMANRGGSQYSIGAFAELIAVPKQPALARQKLEGYLAHKWGLTASLPAGHPFKNSMPLYSGVASFDYLAVTSTGSDSQEAMKLEFEFDLEVPSGNEIIIEFSHSDVVVSSSAVSGWNADSIADGWFCSSTSSAAGGNKWKLTATAGRTIPAGTRINLSLPVTRTNYDTGGWVPFTVSVSMAGTPTAVSSITGPHSPAGVARKTATAGTKASILATATAGTAAVGDWSVATDDQFLWYVYDGAKFLTYDPWPKVYAPSDLAITAIGRTTLDITWTGQPHIEYVLAWGATDQSATNPPSAVTFAGPVANAQWDDWDNHVTPIYQGDYSMKLTGLTPGQLHYIQLYVTPRAMVAGDVPLQSIVEDATTLT